VDPSGHWAYSIGIEAQASAGTGVYSGYALNVDSKGYISFMACAGLLMTTNAVANIGVYAAGYPYYNSVDSLKGFGISIEAAFSLGVKISISSSLCLSPNGKMTRGYCVSYGKGVSMIGIPYFEVKAGYSIGTKKFKFKDLCKWSNNKNKTYKIGGTRLTVKKYKNYIKASNNKLRLKYYIYPQSNKRKIKSVKVKK